MISLRRIQTTNKLLPRGPETINKRFKRGADDYLSLGVSSALQCNVQLAGGSAILGSSFWASPLDFWVCFGIFVWWPCFLKVLWDFRLCPPLFRSGAQKNARCAWRRKASRFASCLDAFGFSRILGQTLCLILGGSGRVLKLAQKSQTFSNVCCQFVCASLRDVTPLAPDCSIAVVLTRQQHPHSPHSTKSH